VLLPGFGCGVCLAGGGGRVMQPGGARVRTGSDRAGLCPPLVSVGWFVLVRRVRAGRRAAASRSGMPLSRASRG
jgi:hypothetical protein